MTPKQFEKYLARDRHCYHCGMDNDLIPHHRLNRGAGGKNAKANQSSNIIVMCAYVNGLMESDAAWATRARERGWKLSSYQNPDEIPVFDFITGNYYLINNNFERNVFNNKAAGLN